MAAGHTAAGAGNAAPPLQEESSKPLVTIIIVNWNSGDLLRRCVESIERHSGRIRTRVVVVDNGSADGSADFAASGPVDLIRAGRNLGFAAACNVGANGARSPFLLFLNPDAQVGPDALDRAVSFMESEAAADVAVCGIRLLSDDGTTQQHTVEFPSARTIFAHSQMRTRFDHLSNRDVDHVIGAFYLIRREVFEALHGFDEAFFVYLEDLDLSRRVRAAGYRVVYLADAVARHIGGGVSSQVKAHRLFYSFRSRLLYAAKHFSSFQMGIVWAGTLLLEPALRLLRALARRSLIEAIDTARAYRMLWGDLPNIWRSVGQLRKRASAQA